MRPDPLIYVEVDVGFVSLSARSAMLCGPGWSTSRRTWSPALSSDTGATTHEGRWCWYLMMLCFTRLPWHSIDVTSTVVHPLGHVCLVLANPKCGKDSCGFVEYHFHKVCWSTSQPRLSDKVLHCHKTPSIPNVRVLSLPAWGQDDYQSILCHVRSCVAVHSKMQICMSHYLLNPELLQYLQKQSVKH